MYVCVWLLERKKKQRGELDSGNRWSRHCILIVAAEFTHWSYRKTIDEAEQFQLRTDVEPADHFFFIEIELGVEGVYMS